MTRTFCWRTLARLCCRILRWLRGRRWRLDQTKRNHAWELIDDVPMLGDLAVGDAEEIGRVEAELVMRGRPPVKRTIIGAGKLHPRHDPVALGDHLQNFGMIIRK